MHSRQCLENQIWMLCGVVLAYMQHTAGESLFDVYFHWENSQFYLHGDSVLFTAHDVNLITCIHGMEI